MFKPKIIYVDPYYYVSNFNFHSLKRYAKKFFGSEKIANFIEVTSDRWFNHSFKIHKFFLPELIYFLKNVNNTACAQLAFIISENTWYNIFLNKPWRYIEYQQASDRIHRIGQDTEVYIYTLLLDTGNKENLSTRMEDIETWSRKMFEDIVDQKGS